MSNIEEYRKFCDQEESLPIFMQHWWLDIVCNSSWDVALSKKSGKIVGCLPFYLKKRGPFNLISQPRFSQFMGPYLKYPESDRHEKLSSFENKTLKELIAGLPHADYLFFNLNFKTQNALPFIWNGYEARFSCTYKLFPVENEEILLRSLRSNIRTDIKKASNSYHIIEGNECDQLFELIDLTFKRQNLPIGFSLNDLTALDRELQKRSCRKVMYAKNEQGDIHAGVYLVWDSDTVYYLLSGTNPDFKNYGLNSFLVWKGLLFASQQRKTFDFEGSTIEGIERFFRGFGATQFPMVQVSKTNSRLLKLRSFWKKI
jgi:hypothetical protein